MGMTLIESVRWYVDQGFHVIPEYLSDKGPVTY
jgi:hypothetical protein